MEKFYCSESKNFMTQVSGRLSKFTPKKKKRDYVTKYTYLNENVVTYYIKCIKTCDNYIIWLNGVAMTTFRY